ncbi:MAG: ABC transporter ATP-binding protein [Chloroflexota bacterium]
MIAQARSQWGTITAQLRTTFTLWRRSLALVFAAAPRQATAMVMLMLGQAFLPVGTLWASRGVVNAAARAFGLTGPATGGAALPLGAWIGLAVGIIIVQQLLAPFFQAAQESASDRLTAHVNGELIAAANRWRGLARFEDPALADHLALARANAANGPVSMLTSAGAGVQSAFIIIAMSAVLWRLHPLVPLLLLLVHIPEALQEDHYGQMMANSMETESAQGRKLGSYVDAVTGAGPAKDVRLFDLGSFFSGLYATIFGHMTADIWLLRRRLLARMAPAQALSGGMAAAVYLYAVHTILSGGFSLGDLVLFGGALAQLEGALVAIGSEAGLFSWNVAWMSSLFAVLDMGPDLPVPAPEHALPAPRPIRSGLVLDHVTFHYPGTSAAVLHDVSLVMHPGERLALVGRNGAGKTTLVKLLARLYDPSEGRILLDGVDLREYDLDDLRRQIAAVFQDFVSYQVTAQENVGLGDVVHVDNLAHVQAAAAKGGAAALIDALPDCYATRLGAQFGGVNLSGGQWQKIALSRAFMRQAQLLILDEPTAALDVQAEYDVYRRFSALTEGAMTVLVSHRFSTVRMADHICYLEDGRLLEEGTHDALVQRAGGYAGLYRLQAELYRDGGTER